jgi:TATA-box binding protein (TBP) (component of TFIID and TFIIIB)
MQYHIANVVGKVKFADSFDTSEIANLSVKRCGRRTTYVIHGMNGKIMPMRPVNKKQIIITGCNYDEFNAILDEIKKTNNVTDSPILNFVLKYVLPFHVDLDKVFYAIDDCKKQRGLPIVIFSYENSKVLVSKIGRGVVTNLTNLEDIDKTMNDIFALLEPHKSS